MDDSSDDRGIVRKIVDAVKAPFTGGALERGLTNQAAAMPGAAGDLNMAGGDTMANTAGVVPGAIGEAAEGTLTDEAPVGRAETSGERDDGLQSFEGHGTDTVQDLDDEGDTTTVARP